MSVILRVSQLSSIHIFMYKKQNLSVYKCVFTFRYMNVVKNLLPLEKNLYIELFYPSIYEHILMDHRNTCTNHEITPLTQEDVSYSPTENPHESHDKDLAFKLNFEFLDAPTNI